MVKSKCPGRTKPFTCSFIYTIGRDSYVLRPPSPSSVTLPLLSLTCHHHPLLFYVTFAGRRRNELETQRFFVQVRNGIRGRATYRQKKRDFVVAPFKSDVKIGPFYYLSLVLTLMRLRSQSLFPEYHCVVDSSRVHPLDREPSQRRSVLSCSSSAPALQSLRVPGAWAPCVRGVRVPGTIWLHQ